MEFQNKADLVAWVLLKSMQIQEAVIADDFESAESLSRLLHCEIKEQWK